MSRAVGTVLVGVILLAGCVGAGNRPTDAPSPSGSSLPGAAAIASSPSPAVSPSPAASLSPSAADPFDGLAWHSLGAIPSPDVRHVVGFAKGYVAIGWTRTIWYSADGAVWTAVSLPFTVTKDTLDAGVNGVATDGTRVLVVGGYAHTPCAAAGPPTTGGGPGCPLAPLAWTSADGRTWTSAYPGPLPADPPGYSQGSEFVAAWPVPTGGWDAAVSYWAGESLHGRDLMHSTNGLTWTALEPAPALATGDSDPFPWVHEAVADTTGLRLLWQQWSDYTDPFPSGAGRPVATVATSRDGRTWMAVESFPGKDAEIHAGLAPSVADGSPWLLAGGSGFVDDSTSTPTVWMSPDTISWTRTTLGTASGSLVSAVGSLVHSALGYVAVGASWNGADADHETWLSEDGSAWTSLPRIGALGADFGPGIVADGPAGALGIGVSPTDSEHESVVWQLR